MKQFNLDHRKWEDYRDTHFYNEDSTLVLVVTSALTSADVSLTSGSRSPDETDGAAGSVTHSIFVRFTSNFVHLHSLPRIMSRFSLINFFLPKFLLDGNLEITDGKGNAS